MKPPARTASEIKTQILASMGITSPDLFITGGQIVNTITKEVYTADIATKRNRIVRVGDISDLNSKYSKVDRIVLDGEYVIPGLIDTHLHTESTFLPPTSFTKIALPRGTTTAVVDPHELTNVLGVKGLEFYFEETKNLPMEFLVEIPSCVPAAPSLETGPTILKADIYDNLVSSNNYFALAEMMNFPGVIYGDDDVMQKLSLAERAGKIIEGHAPELQGNELQAYLTGGISSCHESISVDEVLEKLRLGMKIQLREGSFARNLKVLAYGIFKEFGSENSVWSRCITCSDDKHPDDILQQGHIDHSVRMLINDVGLDPITAIQTATINPSLHLQRPDLGILAPGKAANILVINNLERFDVKEVVSQGRHVACGNKLLVDLNLKTYPDWVLQTVKPKRVPTLDDFCINAPIIEGEILTNVIGVLEHSLVTDHLQINIPIKQSQVHLKDDIAYFFLIDRHGNTGNFSKALVSGFGFNGKVGIASTVAHDSHQLLIVGNDSKCMYQAMQNVIKSNGGQSIVALQDDEVVSKTLPLPYAGLMSLDEPEKVAELMQEMKEFSQTYVKGISEPFMSLSFMALPVIPKLKLTDKGLVDVQKFQLIELFIL